MKQSFISILIWLAGVPMVWSQTQPPVNAPADLNRNFVRTEKMLVKGVTSENNVSNLPVEQKTTIYSYVDDMGRPVQSITVQGSPSKQDVIQFQHYDAFGRELQKYLPYTFNNASGYGTYRSNYVNEQANFYSNTQAVAHDQNSYSVLRYDNSPLNQIRKTWGTGWSWHESQENKPVTESLRFNTEGEVFKYTYSGTGFPMIGIGTYPANVLAISEMVDEQGLIKRIFKNFKNQVLLERTGDGTLWHDTYYIYDYAGNITFVFPPEASSRLVEYNNFWASRQQFLDTWCFQYKYDQSGRLIEKKVPGSGWVYNIYDKWDRLILTQDAKQRIGDMWSYTKYDELNRPILTGSIKGSRTFFQNTIDAINSRFFEVRQNNSIGYTNTAFPVHNAPLTITYYDDYSFKNYSGWDEVAGTNYNYVSETGFLPVAQTLTIAKGYTTGTKTYVPGDDRWLNTVTYYDKQYNAVQVIAENNIGGRDRITHDIDFAGRTVKTLHVHTSSMGGLTRLSEFTYDHAGRLKNVFQTFDSGPRILVASHVYNELGQLIEKNLHSENNGTTFLQSVDYRYNIRGWLTNINNGTLTNDNGATNDDTNDLFGMDIIYNQETVNVGGTNADKLYNGNISAIRWKTNNLKDAPQERIYRYKYDAWSRMELAYYAQKNSNVWNGNAGRFNETAGYDNNGNIQNLVRTGQIGTSTATIDQLGYTYTGNRLQNVHDQTAAYWAASANNPDFGFTEVSHTLGITEYGYDANGNMTYDLNKGIEEIKYNHLNLPTQIKFGGNRIIDYTYDALGNKLRTVVRTGNATAHSTTDYVGGIHYQDGQLAFVLTDEGRAVKRNGTYEYEYFLKDHQRNVRVVFGSLKVTDAYKATLEPERDQQEKNVDGFKNITRITGYNRTAKSYEVPNPQYAAGLNGAVGPAKMLTVQPGDKVRLMAHSRYTGSVSGTKIIPSVLAAAVTSAFQVMPTGETSTAYSALNNAVIGATANPNAGAPKAYLCYFIFNSTYTWSQFGYHAISTTSAVAFEALQIDLTIALPAGSTTGYMYAYVANETTGTTVYFDDVEIVHEKNQRALQVVQTSDYYPFGLPIRPLSYQKQTLDLARTKNKYTFQEQEVQDGFDLGWYQYKYRIHDPAIGRFGSVDPLSEKFYYNSTYAFSENRLIDAIELEGLESIRYDFMKYISPIAFNINYAHGTHRTGIGFDISIGVPKVFPFSYRQSFGATLWGYDALQQKPIVETRTGRETSYFGVLSIESKDYSSGLTSQGTGTITLGGPLLNIRNENDWYPNWITKGLDPFNIHPQHIGDSRDGFRTEAFNARFGAFNFGFNLATGMPDKNPSGVDLLIGGNKGTYIKNAPFDPDQFRLGLGYIGFGNFKFGINSEQYIRAPIQNSFHSLIGSPWFRVMPGNTQLFLEYSSSTGTGW
ncbi:MAG: DUF6443 domain-containing protein [Cyclobacteriaceae bacterium]|nr:MAG: DUF6443 domain-containing protein [Cyclobacteriaceae bacterium]